MKYSHLKLKVLESQFKYVLLENKEKFGNILKQSAEEPIALFSGNGEVSAIVPEELTIDCKDSESGWSCIHIVGDMPFGTVQGLVATIGNSLRKNEMGICVVSTYLTDWFFVRSDKLEKIIQTLTQDGWEFV